MAAGESTQKTHCALCPAAIGLFSIIDLFAGIGAGGDSSSSEEGNSSISSAGCAGPGLNLEAIVEKLQSDMAPLSSKIFFYLNKYKRKKKVFF